MRVALVENVLSELQADGAVSDHIDMHTIAIMCFGSYFGAFYRGDTTREPGYSWACPPGGGDGTHAQMSEHAR